MSLFLTLLVIGTAVGFIGARRNWPLFKTYSVAFFLTVINLYVLLTLSSNAADIAIDRLRATTVHISVGSGSIVEGKSGKHYILTNAHVCNYAQWKGTLTAHYPSGETVQGRIVKSSFAVDLCAAEVAKETAALKTASFVLPLATIYTRGFPGHILAESKGRILMERTWNLFFPIEELGECPSGSEKIRDVRGILAGCGLTFTSALSTLYTRPGSSGSPVVNGKGELVGVVSSLHSDSAAEAGLVRFKDVKRFLENL